jgi:predicted transcriptional regulator
MYTTVTVKQILDRKGYHLWSIDADATVFDALRFMAEKNVGALLIDGDEKTVGIFSERDYARKVALKGRSERDTLVKDVMTSEVIVTRLDQMIEECLALMTGKFIRHLPVVNDNEQVIGVISIGDVVKELIVDQAYVIDQLVNYITGEKLKPPIPGKSEFDLQ